MKINNTKWLKAITVTIDLCSQNSFHGTSMDTIADKACLSKATIYKYFSSKECLLYEALKYHADLSIEGYKDLLLNQQLSLTNKINKRFESLREVFLNKRYFGCYFQLAHSEYVNEDQSITQLCADFKNEVQLIVEAMLKFDGIENAKQLATKLEILFNGLLTTLYMAEDEAMIDLVKAMYLKEIQSHMPSSKLLK